MEKWEENTVTLREEFQKFQLWVRRSCELQQSASLVATLFRAPETTRRKLWRASGFTCSVVTACLVFIFLFLVYPPADSSQTWIWDTCSVPYLLPNHVHVCLHRGRDCGLSEKEGLPALTDPNSGNFYTKKITNVAQCSKVNFLL